MYRHKDRIQKSKRIQKKKNCNKEQELVKDDPFFIVDCVFKRNQQLLITKYNIKVHINDLRFIEEHPDDRPMGNSTVKEIRAALMEIEKDNPEEYNGEFKHDMTKWKENKKRSKQRNHERKDKSKLNNIY